MDGKNRVKNDKITETWGPKGIKSQEERGFYIFLIYDMCADIIQSYKPRHKEF